MFHITQNDNFDEERQILLRLKKENREKCSWLQKNPDFDNKHYNFMLFDDTKLIGGATGHIAYDWYFLELLYIEKEYRGRKMGSKLLSEIEHFAKQRGLTGIRLETWDFQARNFYEKLGFTVFGELWDCPPGTKLFLMKKRIDSYLH